MINEKFEEIWAAEMDAQSERAAIAFAGAGVPLFVRERNHRNAKSAQRRLYAMLEALSPSETREYGEYRRGILAEIAARRG